MKEKKVKTSGFFKSCLGCLGFIIIIGIIIGACNDGDNEKKDKKTSIPKTAEVKTETKHKAEEVATLPDDIKKIATSDKTETEKFDEVTVKARNYKPTSDELNEFENYIVNEYKNGTYLIDIKNHEYMLTNIFKATVVERQHDDKDQQPIDNFAFDFLQNTKYTYRGVDAVDSEAVKSNEEQMNKALSKMK